MFKPFTLSVPKNSIILMVFLFIQSINGYSWQWRDLWSTKDQQGQILMEKKDYSAAEETFTRPDWAATAAYRNHDYKKASELYSSQHNETGFYNLGNSLAHLGQYKNALQAYDQALALNPHNQDARHNRKIVENLLKQQQDQQKQQQDQQKQQQDQQKQKQDQQKQQQDQQKQQQDQQKQQQDQQKQQQDQQKQQQDQQKQQQDQQKQQQGQQKQQQDQQKQQQDQQKQQQDQQKQQQDQQKQQQDQQKQQQDQQKQQQDQQKQQQDQQKDQAKAEKKHAQEQWLRLIPDDPGGLLREKFLRDHLRRQQGW